MRWQVGRRSDNVEDQRDSGSSGGGGGFGPRHAAGVGIGTLLIAAAAAYFLGIDPRAVIQIAEQAQSQQAPADERPPGGEGQPGGRPSGQRPADPQGDFAAAILGDTEDAWGAIFQQAGKTYRPPTLVLFSDATRSACGMSSAAVGPFYCPADEKLYLDLTFYNELSERFGAPGDFAQAYVIAHEVGHHVQKLLGISDRVDEARSSGSEADANDLSVRQELQADCYAGVWAKHSKIPLDPGDVEEGLGAAAAIGDDRLQKQSQGYVVPETWTHGSSAMRVKWLRRGLDAGDPNQCDTFAAASL